MGLSKFEDGSQKDCAPRKRLNGPWQPKILFFYCQANSLSMLSQDAFRLESVELLAEQKVSTALL